MLSISDEMIYKQKNITRPITIVALCCVALVYTAPYSSGVYNEYVYNYEVELANGPNSLFNFKAKVSLDILFATKQDGHLPPQPTTTTTSTTSSIADGQTEQATDDSLLVRLKLSEPIFYPGAQPNDGADHTNQVEPLNIEPKYSKLFSPEHYLYAHIVTLSNGTVLVKEIYTHRADVTTFKNIKKSLLLNILPTTHHLVGATSKHQANQQGQDQLLEYISVRPVCTYEHDNSRDQPELFSPDSISQVNIIAKARKSNGIESTTRTASNSIRPINLPIVFQTVDGQQNVTFRSRVFTQAQSNLTTKFSLELVNQIKSNAHEKFDNADSMASAIKLLDDRHNYHADTLQLERERRICSSHHCNRSLHQLFDDYRDNLTDDNMASVEAAVAFLRILDRLRNAQGTGVKEIVDILKQAARGKAGIESSFLDILAAARTRDSIQAALKYLKLPKNRNLDVAERFLSVLSVAAKTASKMHLKRTLQSPYYFAPTDPLHRSPAAKGQLARMASLEFIAKEFLKVYEQVPGKKWASNKLRWSSLLTLATLVNANNQEQNFNTSSSSSSSSSDNNDQDKLSSRVERIIFDELAACYDSDTDCRIVAIQAMGNLGQLGQKQFQALSDQVIKFGRRESNAAMRVLRDLLQNQAKDRVLARDFYEKLEAFLIRIVYEHSQETTSRVLAAEMIVRFVPNSLVSEELLYKLPSFGNNELATMIYSRVQSLKPNSMAVKHHENWYWKSCIINGTSTSFVKEMARTESLTASYGVNVELLDKGKMFKESSFDVLLDTLKQTQDLFSLSIFARGMSGFTGGGGGGSSDGDSDSDGGASESTMAGMSLKLLGGYLRPYVFFNSLPELMSHYMKGTASTPTTAFNGDLLLIDHDEGFPLISGFVAEQQMRGVLSIDVSGEIQIKLMWGRESHSVVTTKASIIVQASQSVFTSYDNFWQSHLFSFGGQALIDFMADVYFTDLPAKTCLQVTQPQFSVRYNSRRHEQMMTNEVSRKLTRRGFKIGAKSYSLNSENNKMCSALFGGEL